MKNRGGCDKMMNGRRLWMRVFVGMVAIVALACGIVMSGCAGGSSTTSQESNSAAGQQTALVVYADDGGVLLVDQETETPFFPTIPEDNLTGLDGQAIAIEDLEVGNVVAIDGNGIMLESYPGQYPGITAMTVIEQGTAQDAEPYAALVAQVCAPAGEEGAPAGWVNYLSESGDVTVALEPYASTGFEENGAEGEEAAEDVSSQQAVVGSFTDDNGLLNAGAADVRVGQDTTVTVGFDRSFQSIEVSEYPLANDDADQPRVDLKASQQQIVPDVPESGEAAFTIQPNCAYDITVKFAGGEAHYAFTAMN